MSELQIQVAREKVVTAALRYLTAERADDHSSRDAELEYSEDALDRAAHALSVAGGMSP